MSIRNGWYRNVGSFLTVTAVISGFNPVIASANISSSDFSMRDKVVSLTGIMELTNNTGIVTRGEFAKMLVNASSYRENLSKSDSSVFKDVPAQNPNAEYIKIAASQGLMTGYLGGVFKPENNITYRESVKAVLTLLGYKDEDFTGNITSSRISKFQFLELNEN